VREGGLDSPRDGTVDGIGLPRRRRVLKSLRNLMVSFECRFAWPSPAENWSTLAPCGTARAMHPSLPLPHAVWTLVALLGLTLGGVLAGCGTEPVNPDGCRKIEEARCAAIVACPGYESLDVEACKRFYRDQCLHGLATASDPGDPAINVCTSAIEAAGNCAKTGTAVCTIGATSAAPCEVIEHPELYPACAFLLPPGAAGADAGAEAEASAEPDADGADGPLDDAG